jgi:hypothetical protein
MAHFSLPEHAIALSTLAVANFYRRAHTRKYAMANTFLLKNMHGFGGYEIVFSTCRLGHL